MRHQSDLHRYKQLFRGSGGPVPGKELFRRFDFAGLALTPTKKTTGQWLLPRAVAEYRGQSTGHAGSALLQR